MRAGMVLLMTGLWGITPAPRRVLTGFLVPGRRAYVVGGMSGTAGGVMGTDHRDEIAASVAAHQDLGPGYDRAVAEGLVERIGAEIDHRVATAIDQRVTTELEQYLDCRHLRRARRRARVGREGRPSVLLALGSMAAAVAGTAIVIIDSSSSVDFANGGATRSGPGAAAVLLTALIWIVVGVINVAYARRRRP